MIRKKEENLTNEGAHSLLSISEQNRKFQHCGKLYQQINAHAENL